MDHAHVMPTRVGINLKSPNRPTLYEWCVHMYVLIEGHLVDIPYMNQAYTYTC